MKFLPFFLAVFLASFPALAGAPASVVAILDVQRLMQESLAAKSVQQQLETRRQAFQTEISAEEAGLRKAEQALAKDRETKKPDVFAEQEQQLRQRFLIVERHVQARRKALDQAYTDSMNAVRKSIVEIVAMVSKEKKVNLVIVKQQVIWNDNAVDITEEVLGRLNKELPNLEVKVISDEDSLNGAPLIMKKPKTPPGKK